MDALGAASSATQPRTEITQLTSETVDQADFLKLLVAQLQNQDPLNPTENQEFVAELATFSSLEQQQNQTLLLEQLLSAQSSGTTSQALSLIGNEVLAETNVFNYSQGQELPFSFLANAGPATINIKTPSGRLVASSAITVGSAGRQDLTFPTVTSTGEPIPSGQYVIEAGTPINDEGDSTPYPVFLRGAVDAVTFEGGTPVLTVQNQTVDMSSIFAVMQPRSDDELDA